MTVVVAGAGPAGLVLAYLLHRDGIPVTVLEPQERAALGTVPRAGIVEHRTVEMLRAAGIAGPVLTFEAQNGACEFRTPGDAVRIDYGDLTGGRPHWVFPQHRLVDEMVTALVDAGGDVRFGCRVEAVDQDAGGARVAVRDAAGERSELCASAVVGADGAGGVVADALDGVTVHERGFPERWLVISAATPPLCDHTIYAVHPHGYAAHMRRAPDETRFYLGVDPDGGPDDWPPDRLAAELGERLGEPGRLDGVRFGEVGVLDLRVRVREPMQDRRLFLVGDAAHLITPAGGKGMNLALGDAVELAYGLIDRYGPAGDGTRLDAYSATRLPVIWRTQAFSDWFLAIISGASAGPFGQGLRAGWVSALRTDPLLARWFAHAYAGASRM